MNRLVIGVGNEFRCDDVAGLEVARRVKTVPAMESSLGGLELLDMWAGAGDVIVVDAMSSGAAPGTIQSFDPHSEPLPADDFASTHAIGVGAAVAMAHRLGRLPGRLTVYGIEAASLAVGTAVSPEVERAIAELVGLIDGDHADA